MCIHLTEQTNYVFEGFTLLTQVHENECKKFIVTATKWTLRKWFRVCENYRITSNEFKMIYIHGQRCFLYVLYLLVCTCVWSSIIHLSSFPVECLGLLSAKAIMNHDKTFCSLFNNAITATPLEVRLVTLTNMRRWIRSCVKVFETMLHYSLIKLTSVFTLYLVLSLNKLLLYPWQ